MSPVNSVTQRRLEVARSVKVQNATKAASAAVASACGSIANDVENSPLDLIAAATLARNRIERANAAEDQPAREAALAAWQATASKWEQA
jgi:hypothetical protein